MGSWGTGSFENDCALDWVLEVLETDDLSFIEQTFLEALDEKNEYLDVDLGCNVLAAAEVIAFLVSRDDSSPVPDIPSLKKWISRHRFSVPDELVQLCLLALERTLGDDSELVDLWEEAGPESMAEWRAETERLKGRLPKKVS